MNGWSYHIIISIVWSPKITRTTSIIWRKLCQLRRKVKRKVEAKRRNSIQQIHLESRRLWVNGEPNAWVNRLELQLLGALLNLRMDQRKNSRNSLTKLFTSLSLITLQDGWCGIILSRNVEAFLNLISHWALWLIFQLVIQQGQSGKLLRKSYPNTE